MEQTPDIIEVKALENYYLYLKFSNGEERIYNMKDTIEKIEYFNRLKRREYFINVKPRGDTIEWQNGEDVAPENLYYDSIPIKK